jgi:hypothetical protein
MRNTVVDPSTHRCDHEAVVGTTADPSLLPITPIHVVKLNEFSFFRCDPRAMVGKFRATTDSNLGQINVQAIIQHRGTDVCIHYVRL